jgi:hypothetical protein
MPVRCVHSEDVSGQCERIIFILFNAQRTSRQIFIFIVSEPMSCWFKKPILLEFLVIRLSRFRNLWSSVVMFGRCINSFWIILCKSFRLGALTRFAKEIIYSTLFMFRHFEKIQINFQLWSVKINIIWIGIRIYLSHLDKIIISHYHE